MRPRGVVVVAAVAVVLVLVVTQLLRPGHPESGFRDKETAAADFYAWTDPVPGDRGELLRTQAFTEGLPEGAHGWRFLYSTVDELGNPAVGSASLLIGGGPAEDRDLVVWNSQTTGIAQGCAPSEWSSFDSSPLPALLDQGWAVVAPDYLGLGVAGPSPYLIGAGEGESALDAAEAAHDALPDLIGDDAVVWGYSQGGHAALWTSQLWSSEDDHGLNLLGTVALAPVTDVTGWMDYLGGQAGWSPVGFSYVATAYAAAYPGFRVADGVGAGSLDWVGRFAETCNTGTGLGELMGSFGTDTRLDVREPLPEAWTALFAENTPRLTPAAVPALVLQGQADSTVPAAITARWAADQCGAGATLDYRSLDDIGHDTVVRDDVIAPAVEWTKDRFAGEPAAAACPEAN